VRRVRIDVLKALNFAKSGHTGGSLSAAKILDSEGINACVVNVSTVKPIDVDTIVELAGKTGAVVTAEDHSINGGLGGVISEILGENCPTPIKRIGMYDRFGTSGNGLELINYFGMDATSIVDAVHELLNFSKKVAR